MYENFGWFFIPFMVCLFVSIIMDEIVENMYEKEKCKCQLARRYHTDKFDELKTLGKIR